MTLEYSFFFLKSKLLSLFTIFILFSQTMHSIKIPSLSASSHPSSASQPFGKQKVDQILSSEISRCSISRYHIPKPLGSFPPIFFIKTFGEKVDQILSNEISLRAIS